jgi:hypothetical protein
MFLQVSLNFIFNSKTVNESCVTPILLFLPSSSEHLVFQSPVFKQNEISHYVKNVVFWDFTKRGSCKNRRFGETYGLHHQGDKNRFILRFPVTADVPSSPILVTLMMEALISSETPFLQEPQGITTQKTAFFLVTAVKTSSLLSHQLFLSMFPS